TTTTSSSCDAHAWATTSSRSGRPRTLSSCLGSPLRAEPPAGRTRPPARPPAASTMPADRPSPTSARGGAEEARRVGGEALSAVRRAEREPGALVLDAVLRGGLVHGHTAERVDADAGRLGARRGRCPGEPLAPPGDDAGERVQGDLLLGA